MSDRAEQEHAIREAFDAGDLERAATVALVSYGREIFSFLARQRARSDADETFSMFTESLWAGIPSFGWRCSMRTWCYVLAQNALRRYESAPDRRMNRNVPLSCPGIMSRLVADCRTATHPYQQTDVKDRFRKLRERMDEADQLLMLLRVDRKLSFREVAITILGDVDPDATVLAREEARLRQAFLRLKVNVRRMAEEEGLLEPRP